MKILFLFAITIILSNLANAKIDVDELRCLVCQKSLDELSKAVSQIDPTKKIDVGGYQLDKDGNIKQKKVSQAKSEIHLSEIIEEICNKMDDYVRATSKSNGKLLLLRLIGEDGQMSPLLGEVDIIQDDDLNKSLKYYCEGIMEEYEENIIRHFQNDSKNIESEVCLKETGLCKNYVDNSSSRSSYTNEEL